ncbi:MAG TPA: CbtB-domain containing protein [Mycobacteriales bacterium]|nr:CbtB-domain containing protein [Mycobacteriales bacterium]
MTTPAAPATPSAARSVVVNALLPALVATFTLFAVAFDQGQITGAVASGVDGMLMHELFHDARHMLGFPCH